jgi:hypothetical protein
MTLPFHKKANSPNMDPIRLDPVPNKDSFKASLIDLFPLATRVVLTNKESDDRIVYPKMKDRNPQRLAWETIL